MENMGTWNSREQSALCLMLWLTEAGLPTQAAGKPGRGFSLLTRDLESQSLPFFP